MEPGLTPGPWGTRHLIEERAEDRALQWEEPPSLPTSVLPFTFLALRQIALPVVILLAVSCAHLRSHHRSAEITDIQALPVLWGTEDGTLT